MRKSTRFCHQSDESHEEEVVGWLVDCITDSNQIAQFYMHQRSYKGLTFASDHGLKVALTF